jgi:hypothetical protein
MLAPKTKRNRVSRVRIHAPNGTAVLTTDIPAISTARNSSRSPTVARAKKGRT